VSKNFEALIVKRGKDAGIIAMYLKVYNSLMATNYEFTSRANEARLDAAIDKFINYNSLV